MSSRFGRAVARISSARREMRLAVVLMGIAAVVVPTAVAGGIRGLHPHHVRVRNALPVYRAPRRWEQRHRRAEAALGTLKAADRQAVLARIAHGQPAPGRPGDEVTALRTATSRTFIGPHGTYEAVISQSPMNYGD